MNASRLHLPREEFIASYRNHLEHHLADPIDDRTWDTLLEAGIVAAALMLLWTKAMGLKKRSAEALWTYGKAWLHREIRKPS